METTRIFDQQNYTDKITWKEHGFFDHQNYMKKVLGNNKDFLISEILLKKYAEMTWKFVEIWSSTYRCNIDVELTWILRGVPVRYCFSWSSNSFGWKKLGATQTMYNYWFNNFVFIFNLIILLFLNVYVFINV